MSEFVRVKLLAYEAGSASAVAAEGPGSEYVAVKILEASKSGTVCHTLESFVIVCPPINPTITLNLDHRKCSRHRRNFVIKFYVHIYAN